MSPRAAVLTLDAGTGSGRASVFDLEGRLLAVAARRWTFTTPPSLDPFGKQFEADEFLALLAEAVQEALARADRPEVRAISTTGLRGGSVLLDGAGTVLAASPIQDVRGLLVVGDVDGAVPDLYRRTGHTPTWLFPLSRLAWYRSEAPDVFARITTLLSIDEWLLFALSGERRATEASAGDSMCLDVARRSWDGEIFERLGLAASLAPAIARAGDVVGDLTSGCAARFGVAPGIPVVACAGDTQAALLGSAVLDPGTVGVVAGTTAPVMAVASAPTADPAGSLWMGCHPLRDRWVLEGNSGRAGSSFDWTLALLGLEDVSRFAEAEKLAAAAAPCANGAFAFLGAEPVDLSKLNPQRPAGFLFPAPELGVPVGRAEIVRATLENVAFAVEANLRRIDAAIRLEDSAIALSGGLGSSDVFAAIIADVTGRSVRRGAHAQGASLGAAVCAATGLGQYSSLREAVGAMVTTVTTVDPDRDRHTAYRDAFESWYSRWQVLQSIT